MGIVSCPGRVFCVCVYGSLCPHPPRLNSQGWLYIFSWNSSLLCLPRRTFPYSPFWSPLVKLISSFYSSSPLPSEEGVKIMYPFAQTHSARLPLPLVLVPITVIVLVPMALQFVKRHCQNNLVWWSLSLIVCCIFLKA